MLQLFSRDRGLVVAVVAVEFVWMDISHVLHVHVAFVIMGHVWFTSMHVDI